MITFAPTKGLIRSTNIDFELLSFIFSRFIKVKRKKVLRVERSKKSYSYYCDNNKVVCINTNEGTSLKFIVATLLHEIRHYMQFREKTVNISSEYTSYWNYYNSPEERDARKFERVATEVCRIYTQYKNIEEKIKKYDLENLKELCYNERVDSNDLQKKLNNKQ